MQVNLNLLKYRIDIFLKCLKKMTSLNLKILEWFYGLILVKALGSYDELVVCREINA